MYALHSWIHLSQTSSAGKNPFKFLVSKLDRVRQEKAIKLLMTALALDETIRLSTSIVSAQATQTIAEVLSHVNRSVIKLSDEIDDEALSEHDSEWGLVFNVGTFNLRNHEVNWLKFKLNSKDILHSIDQIYRSFWFAHIVTVDWILWTINVL